MAGDKEVARNDEGYYCGKWSGFGIKLPSVTTVLSLISSYDKVDKAILERAQQFGQAVHTIVDLYERGELDEGSLRPTEEYFADMTPILDAWKLFKLERKVVIERTEEPVVSLRHGYAGTFDAVGTIARDGYAPRRVLIEIKSRPYNKMLEPLQTAAYLEAWNENCNPKLKATERRFVELRLDGTYRTRPIKGSMDFHYFRSVLAAWNWQEKNK